MASPAARRRQEAASQAQRAAAEKQRAARNLTLALGCLARGEIRNFVVLAWRMDDDAPHGGKAFADRCEAFAAEVRRRKYEAAEALFFRQSMPEVFDATPNTDPPPEAAVAWPTQWARMEELLSLYAGEQLWSAAKRIGAF